jgi:hypothetical protein
MELKNINPEADNVVPSNLISISFIFLKIVKMEFKNEDLRLFFLKDTMIARKTKFLISYTSQSIIK